MAKTDKKKRADIVAKATDLYWEKGFHGTSMRNLQEVIDIRPGSIYAAFGSKEGLFKEALQHYAQQGLQHLSALKENSDSPLAALKQFVKSAVIDSQMQAPSGMCMLAKTISELTEDNADLLSEAKRLLTIIEDSFASTLLEAQQMNEIPSHKDCQQLARNLQVQIMGLRTYSRVNYQPEIIANMIDATFLALQQNT
ncbi:TetR/AcrR family transcriptional regulator [Psychromonas aquatilis]|uniref:TetR/AcrR family transcriptional regulator n=1 Tax=Psychromonas aquatilis TaxID=2005072 RepID=A0ABU9GQF9_9GAMM